MTSIYKSALVLRKIDEYISEGYTSYKQLPDDYKSELTVLCVQALGPDEAECIAEHRDFDCVVHLLNKYILSPTHENAYELAEKLKRNTTEYFENHLSEIYSEQFNYYEADLMREHGMYPHQHKDNGEIYWRSFI